MKKFLAVSWAAKHRDVGWVVLRVVTGLVFAMHGYQKWQGGIEQTSGFLGSLGFPAPDIFAVALIVAELVGGIALILGAFTRFAALANAIVAATALFTVHIGNGFFISDGGYEFILLLFAASVALMTGGAGKWSLDPKLKV
jgi:putative oxidoreductase